MSGIAAILQLDGAPPKAGGIEAMCAAMSYRGPDGIAYWRGDSAALGHLMMRTTRESLEEVQPLANEDESLILVMDGHLHNWTELREDLLSRGARLRTRSDAELVLRAFEIWGRDCLIRLEGEFSLLVWDPRNRRALLARDHAGLRPLHYNWDGERLVVASDLAAFMALDGAAMRPNPGMIVEHLADEWISHDETVWEGVLRVVQAHWVEIDPGCKRSARYWEPPFEVTIRHRSEQDYAEEYRELLIDCVRRSSRSVAPLAFEVSGGLDSSANFAVAHGLLKAGRLEAPSIDPYCFLFDKSEIEADEIEYARAVTDHLGVVLNEIPPAFPSPAWCLEQSLQDADMAMFPNTAMSLAMWSKYRAAGSRVAINGEGGDEWTGGKPFYYAEYFRGREFGKLLSAAREDWRDVGAVSTALYLGRFGFGRFVPGFMKALRRRLLLPRGPNQFDGAFWLKPEFDILLTQRRAAVDKQDFMRIPGLPQRYKYMILHDPFLMIARDWSDRLAAQSGFEYRAPMYARRFIEYSFTTPERLRFRGDTRKWLHSKAMAGILPAKVTTRKTKADFSVAFTRPMAEVQVGLRAELAESSGCLDPAGVERLFACQANPDPDLRAVWEAWGLLSCRYLRHALDGRPVPWTSGTGPGLLQSYGG
jgi:asparagine synthase (glutamine-hydrolysing)